MARRGKPERASGRNEGTLFCRPSPVADPSGIGAADPAREAGYKALTRRAHSLWSGSAEGLWRTPLLRRGTSHAADTTGGERTLRRRARPKAARGSSSARAPPSSREGWFPSLQLRTLATAARTGGDPMRDGPGAATQGRATLCATVGYKDPMEGRRQPRAPPPTRREGWGAEAPDLRAAGLARLPASSVRRATHNRTPRCHAWRAHASRRPVSAARLATWS